MSISYIHSEPARGILNVLSEQGVGIETAVLIYKDNNGDVCWHESDNMAISEAILLLEKVKLELLSRA
ncbi:MAG: hypothetical protein GY807_16535 [Gammaproteobacteria bacterium]|nr:hypothetical protein [Gammaproteobacteria bacterium]